MMALLWIAGGIVLLYGGAELLLRGSIAIASRLGITPLVIGLTVVAYGTSMPEMLVSVDAALAGNGAIAIGNVVGSNIGNIGLILGLAALLQPPQIQGQVVRFDVPILIAVSGLAVFFLHDGAFGRWEGAAFLLGVILYTGAVIRIAKRESAGTRQEYQAALPPALGSSALAGVWVILGLVLLVLGAEGLVHGAVILAEEWGISQAVIGLTVVAIGTSLPELATSLLAAFKGNGDIAVGNIVGSNLFNLLGILGVSAVVRPLTAEGIGGIDLGVMMLLALVLLPLMRSGFQLTRLEGGFLVLSYGAYMVYLGVATL